MKTLKGTPAGRGPVWGESGVKVTQLRPALCDSMDCSPPGSSAHVDSPGKDTGVGSLSLRGIFRTRDRTRVSRVARESFTTELPGKPRVSISVSSTLIANEKA